MDVTLSMLSTPRVGGGCTYVAVTTPDAAVDWSLDGPGTLTPSGSRANAAGVATAWWAAGNAETNDAITVTVDVYA